MKYNYKPNLTVYNDKPSFLSFYLFSCADYTRMILYPTAKDPEQPHWLAVVILCTPLAGPNNKHIIIPMMINNTYACCLECVRRHMKSENLQIHMLTIVNSEAILEVCST